MRRLTQRLLAATVAATAVLGTACGASTSTTTAATATTPTTETFTGTLNANGGHTYPFVAAAGVITLTLTTLLPDNTIAVGISLGTWSGTACTVNAGLFNDAATAPATITGQATSTASLCARVYDGGGLIVAPLTYTITVVHQ